MEGEIKHFFLKLIPPWSTSAETMTEDERKIMQEHVVYWKDLLERGICIVYGPVFDPHGNYGIGMVGVEDESIVRDIQINDPSVKADWIDSRFIRWGQLQGKWVSNH